MNHSNTQNSQKLTFDKKCNTSPIISNILANLKRKKCVKKYTRFKSHYRTEHPTHKQHYGDRTYDRIFVPYRNIIRFIRSGYVQWPIWYIERHEPDPSKRQDVNFGSSGKKWDELLICPECQKKININQAEKCQICEKELCPDCIKVVGLIFNKKLCTTCKSENR